MNPFRMDGRNVLVTGASSGIGRGVADCLAMQGARLILVARDTEKLNEVRETLSGSGHLVESIDLLDTANLSSWFKQRSQTWGTLNGLVHCAGIMTMRLARSMDPSDWDVSLRINVIAAATLAKAFRQQIRSGEGGGIVFASSIAGLVGQPAQSIYGSTKGALMAMSRSLAVEFAPEKIRVNCVAPAVVETGMSFQIKQNLSAEQWSALAQKHPLGFGKVEDVAHAVLYLLADTGRWVTGTTLVVDGGYTAQ